MKQELAIAGAVAFSLFSLSCSPQDSPEQVSRDFTDALTRADINKATSFLDPNAPSTTSNKQLELLANWIKGCQVSTVLSGSTINFRPPCDNLSLNVGLKKAESRFYVDALNTQVMHADKFPNLFPAPTPSSR